MADLIADFYNEVAARLAAAPGWPASVHRNRGRLTLWQDVATGATRAAANVLDGRPVVLGESIEHAGAMVEFEQDCVIDLLIAEPDDASRAEALDRALASLVPALMPLIGSAGRRDLTLGGRCYNLRVDSHTREGVILDSTAGIAGVRVRLAALMRGEVPGIAAPAS